MDKQSLILVAILWILILSIMLYNLGDEWLPKLIIIGIYIFITAGQLLYYLINGKMKL